MALITKYISAMAAGWSSGAAIHTGSSADPYQFTEAYANQTDANIWRIKADGTYALAGGTYTLSGGSSASPRAWIADAGTPQFTINAFGSIKLGGMVTVRGLSASAINDQVGSAGAIFNVGGAGAILDKCSVLATFRSSAGILISSAAPALVQRCYVNVNNSLSASAVDLPNSSNMATVLNSKFVNPFGIGMTASLTFARRWILGNEIIASASSAAISLSGTNNECALIAHNSLSGLKGIDFIAVPTGTEPILAFGNVFYGKGSSNGIDLESGTNYGLLVAIANAIGGVSSAYATGDAYVDDAITIASNPFTSSSDLSLVAGSSLRGNGPWADRNLDGTADNYRDFGALQHQDSGSSSGGGSIFRSPIFAGSAH